MDLQVRSEEDSDDLNPASTKSQVSLSRDEMILLLAMFVADNARKACDKRENLQKRIVLASQETR
jgi:hypothetical protein